MPGYYKKARALPVSLRQREVLEQIVRRHKSQQQHVKRAQIILLGGDGFGNGQIADELHIDRKTVYHWRKRWLSQIDQLGQIEAEAEAEDALSKAIVSFLSDAPRPGTPVTYSAEMVCQIITVSCEDPSKCGYPLSHWTPQALRLEVIHRQMVSDISVRQIGRFLKGGGPACASHADRSQAASNLPVRAGARTQTGALLGTAYRRGSG
jgi:putative transposase